MDALDDLERESSDRPDGIAREEAIVMIVEALERHPGFEFDPESDEAISNPSGSRCLNDSHESHEAKSSSTESNRIRTFFDGASWLESPRRKASSGNLPQGASRALRPLTQLLKKRITDVQCRSHKKHHDADYRRDKLPAAQEEATPITKPHLRNQNPALNRPMHKPMLLRMMSLSKRWMRVTKRVSFVVRSSGEHGITPTGDERLCYSVRPWQSAFTSRCGIRVAAILNGH